MKIKFHCNFVLAGWSGRDYDKGRAGGSEELLIQLARYLAKDNEVYVYHNGEHGVFDGVNYLGFKDFKPYEPCDVFISFKAKDSLSESINAKKIIHWSMEIEDFKTIKNHCDEVYAMSNFHKKMSGNVGEVIYNFVDFSETEKFKVEKEEGVMLYSSSYDRGLEELLSKWGIAKKQLNIKKLYIIYGWRIINEIIKSNPGMIAWKNHMLDLMKQDGIEELGEVSKQKMIELYWQSQYWVHPLNNPKSELFCINAIRAEYSGAIPVVRRIGALQETVHDFLDWDEIVGQQVGQSQWNENSFKANRDHALKFSCENIFPLWQEILKK